MVQVVSYIRFSTPKQAQGDSLRRQLSATQDWCNRHGHELDDVLNFRDLGVSAFSGANVSSGAFSALLQLVRVGTLKPGTILVLEALDRLTRQDLTLSVPFLLELLNHGLVVVTLHDGKTWTAAGMRDQSDFILAVLLLARGHGESEYKSGRLRDAFEAQRVEHSNKGFGSAPGWLTRVDKNAPWTVIPDKVASVFKVFELAAAGYGSPAIAKVANAEKWPLPVRITSQTTDAWHSRLPGRIVRDDAVLGRHEYRIRTYEAQATSWNGKSSGVVVEDFYPRIIDDVLWFKAQAGVSSRSHPRRRDDQFFNIWSGLLYCGYCGGSMQRKLEHRGTSRGQILCGHRMSGATVCPSASVLRTDPTLLREITLYAGSALGVQQQASEVAQSELQAQQVRLAQLELSSERVGEALATTGDSLPVLVRQASELGAQRTEVLKTIAKLTQQIATFEPDFFDDAYFRSIIEILYIKTPDAMKLRAECNQRLLRAVTRIWLWPNDMALVQYRDAPDLQAIPLPTKKDGDTHTYFLKHLQGLLAPPV